MKNNRGATIILAIGISTLLLVFAIGIGKVIQNSSYSIKAFKNKWQAELIADSVKEQLMLKSKDQGAGFTVEEGSGATGCWNDASMEVGKKAGTIEEKSVSSSDTEEKAGAGGPPQIAANTSVSGKCSIKGKNDVGVVNENGTTPIPCTETDPNKCYTIPTANTGNAASECNSKYPVKDGPNLIKWVATYLPLGNSTDIAEKMFKNGSNLDPLLHPCNWGKLKFGTEGGKKVIVPLYYTEKDVNGAIVTNQIGSVASDQLYIRVRPPCKQIKDRDATKGAGDSFSKKDCQEQSNKSNPECQYSDICSDGNRYEIKDNCSGVGLTPNCSSNKTLVVWQIAGECDVYDPEALAGAIPDKQPCAIIHNQEIDGVTRPPQNSEIYESRINQYNDNNSLIIDISKYGTLTAKKLTQIPTCIRDTSQPTISEFLNPSLYNQCPNDIHYPFLNISNPTLQLAITEPEVKDIGEKKIPYLEYQIVTNKPIANPLEIFNADVNFLGQNFRLSEAVEQVKNVIDFAIQN